MSMCHKAFAFDWMSFERELLPILLSALEANETAGLTAFIESNIGTLSDPYEGETLTEDWQSLLENQDVQELGDFALTRYYDPSDDCGLGDDWITLNASLSAPAQAALLGSPLGPETNRFDPGRMGSYFQTPADVRRSRASLRPLKAAPIRLYKSLLDRCGRRGLGVYVTF
jgi:hypothetical protein